MQKLLKGEALVKKCEELNIDTLGERIYKSSLGRFNATDSELQQRLTEYKRSKRESRLWIIALISSIAAIVSAATAIVAVIVNLVINLK